MSNPSTPTRRSGRLAGTPTVSSTPTKLIAQDETVYTWGPFAEEPNPSEGKTFYTSFVRKGVLKQPTRGKKKTDAVTEPEPTLQRFCLGDGVLVAVLGNDVGVGLLTKIWEQPAPDEDDDEDEDMGSRAQSQQERFLKLCEIRWFYRKQDLPTTMNSLKLADVGSSKLNDLRIYADTNTHSFHQHELLYAFTGSNRPVTSHLPLSNLINVCSIISSERFKELYPMFHPSWDSQWKIQLAIDSSSDEDESSDEEVGTDVIGSSKTKSNWEKELKIAAKKAPPSMNMHTSTGGFNLYKRAVPLVYFCQKAFDKFAKGGKGKSWFTIDWDKVCERGTGEDNWDLTEDVKIISEEEKKAAQTERDMTPRPEKKTHSRARRVRSDSQRPKRAEGDQSSSDESDASQLRGIESESSDDVSGSDGSEEDVTSTPRGKRKRSVRAQGGKRKRRDAVATPLKRRKLANKRKKIRETYEAITSQLEPHLLPKDPYERALHLLHVGATPDSLPCRESEFVDVLMRVEEGVEGGGGGCLCEFYGDRSW
jgi:hypothetical protein